MGASLGLFWALMSTTTTTLEGILERVVVQSDDDGFTVARLQVRGKST